MPQPLTAHIPLLSLDNGCVVQFEAVDATTGAAVSGVTVSDVSIYATHDDVGDGALEDVAPLFVPLPTN